MKKLCLLFALFSISPTPKLSIVGFNLDNNIYIIEQTDDIAIKTLHKDTVLSISCLHHEPYALSEIDFSKAPQCLIDTLNQAYDLDIDYYVDFKQQYQMKELKQILKKHQLSQMLEIYQTIDTNVTLIEAMKHYDNLAQLLKMDIHYEYPFLVKSKDHYYSFAPFQQ